MKAKAVLIFAILYIVGGCAPKKTVSNSLPKKETAQTIYDCNSLSFADSVAEASFLPKFKLAKTYSRKISEPTRRKYQFSVVLAKGTTYSVNVSNANGTPEGVIATLYNANKDSITSTYIDGQYQRSLTYACDSSYIYYLGFSFKPFVQNCAGKEVKQPPKVFGGVIGYWRPGAIGND